MPVHSISSAADAFARTISVMTAARVRPEVSWSPIPAPGRMAPHTWACSGEAELHDDEVASGRLVVLHDPAGDADWQGRYRMVALVQARLEPEFAVEAMLGDVAWSWVTESLELAGADAHELGCTATRVVSQSYGALASRPSTVDVEMRISWTPDENPAGAGGPHDAVDLDLAPHFAAWSSMLAAAGGLPPAPVAPLAPAHRARAVHTEDAR
ncbi:DUF3000 domain-containing protein [Brachybacterium huguangmaarense]